VKPKARIDVAFCDSSHSGAEMPACSLRKLRKTNKNDKSLRSPRAQPSASFAVDRGEQKCFKPPVPKTGVLPLRSPSFSISFLTTKGLGKEFGSGTMYENVAPHAWSPHDFPHSEEEAKAVGASKCSLEFSRSCVEKYRIHLALLILSPLG